MRKSNWKNKLSTLLIQLPSLAIFALFVFTYDKYRGFYSNLFGYRNSILSIYLAIMLLLVIILI
ncbi:hypothetical protein ACFLYU_03745, partial [Candidatus Dependentiae bacterium]